jgi:hypothetical protein
VWRIEQRIFQQHVGVQKRVEGVDSSVDVGERARLALDQKVSCEVGCQIPDKIIQASSQEIDLVLRRGMFRLRGVAS